MDNDPRHDPPKAAQEKEMLEAFLDYQRDTVLLKASGVSDEDLRRTPTVSSMSLLGMIKHLAYVERSWFQVVFLNRELSVPWTKEDPDADFRIEPDETTASVLAFYQDSVEESRKIAAESSLDAVAQKPGRDATMRWILLHMIEETARHAGHADIIREALDGVTGE
ncbi:MAG TPA: DinB family protein [Chloroflexia bacterium]|nr:DinB family protein [Chloroflexia bacterium]